MKTKVYLHSDTDRMISIGEELGLRGNALATFADALYKVEFDLEVNRVTGEAEITHVDGLKLENPNIEKIKTEESWIAYFDGSAKPNPGERSIGWLIKDNNGKSYDTNHHTKGFGTNNEAEYLALLDLVIHLAEGGFKNVIIRGDSQLVVNQLTAGWKINKDTLKELNRQIKIQLERLENWKLEWVPRDKNSEADYLSQMGGSS